MENTGNTFIKDFKTFLRHDRRDEGKVEEKQLETDIQQLLMDRGVPFKEAFDAQLEFYDKMSYNVDAAYSQGIQDGAQLMLYLLGKAPKDKTAGAEKIQYKIADDADDMEQTMWAKAVADGVFLVEAGNLDEFLKDYPDAVEVKGNPRDHFPR